jgi:NifU-like protein involved in Fe-S cluster formation
VASAAALYTPEVLALATSLAEYPLDEKLNLRGSARSPACGSTLELGLALDGQGRISRLGLKAHACAIGQAAAAIFAKAAPGRTKAELKASLNELENWLGGADALPAWPGLHSIIAARAYPARHGAIMLAWRAALAALPSDENAR